ncbi:MAG: glycosyltransferase [Acidobacteriota bacterium]|nr:glycosyltransferase [Acidobacteriota bacterium]MDW3229159.1 glycosyltransferase [Acidobacteriota bacterium]MDY0231613.1 glycosyltransferase [Candidatus Saccharicenans sp.]
MISSIDDYRSIVGDEVIHTIFRKAGKVAHKHIVHINSTFQGGGVAEILASLVSLMNDVGIFTGWRILHGSPDFFSITKKFHNALQGGNVNLTSIKKELYTDYNEYFSRFTHLNHDLVIVHDPQPLPMIKYYRKRQPWIWRCHVDLSNPNPALWEYLKSFIIRYDMVIVSNESFKKNDLPVPQRVHYPCIDPLSAKNKPLDKNTIKKYLNKFGIPNGKPIITQISRFDKWKDPEGVLKIFELVKKEVDCRLVLCGNLAADDPEGGVIYQRVLQKAKNMKDVIIILEENNILVNALQSTASVVIQKSLREGFGLTVTEALWKRRPVVASNAGGIPLQIIDGKTGFLVKPNDLEGFASKIIKLLKEPELAHELGENGRAHVKENFLITRSLLDYLEVIQEFFD